MRSKSKQEVRVDPFCTEQSVQLSKQKITKKLSGFLKLAKNQPVLLRVSRNLKIYSNYFIDSLYISVSTHSFQF